MSMQSVKVPNPGSDVIARAQKGEEAAFRVLFDAHKRRVYSVCLRMTRSPADAEDLTQEAFLKAFKKIGTFRCESTFSTWLHRVTVNEVLIHLRKKRLPQVSLDEVENSQEGARKREYGGDDRGLMGTIDRIVLNRAIGQLAPGFRTALRLFNVEGYEHTEIAKITETSIGNSKSQLHKARRKLRELLCVQSAKPPLNAPGLS